MTDIEKLIDGFNLPKQIIEKAEAMLKTLFGPSFEEFGGMIGDQVRLRRFNNQIKIFTKAQERLRQSKIDPQKVSLKILSPLIEYSSLEEEENLQDKWANLIAHILGGNKEVVFQQNCITILNRLSAEEASLLEKLHDIMLKMRTNRYKSSVEAYERGKIKFPNYYKTPPKNPEEYPLASFLFNINSLSKDLNISVLDLDFIISNLISLGLLKWETNVKVSASKSSSEPDDTDIDVDVDVYNNINFIFTSIGDKFIRICKE